MEILVNIFFSLRIAVWCVKKFFLDCFTVTHQDILTSFFVTWMIFCVLFARFAMILSCVQCNVMNVLDYYFLFAEIASCFLTIRNNEDVFKRTKKTHQKYS